MNSVQLQNEDQEQVSLNENNQQLEIKSKQKQGLQEEQNFDWSDPFQKLIQDQFDDDGQKIEEEQPTEFDHLWFFFEDTFPSQLEKMKDQVIQILKILLLVTVYAFFGMAIVIYYACYPEQLVNQNKNQPYEKLSQDDERDQNLASNKSKKTPFYDITELMATLWYNLSHLIYWKSTVKMGDDQGKDYETVKQDINEKVQQSGEAIKEAIESTKEKIVETYDKTQEVITEKLEGSQVQSPEEKKEQEQVVAQTQENQNVQPPTPIADEQRPEKFSERDENQKTEVLGTANAGEKPIEHSIDLDLYNKNSLESSSLVEPTFTARAMGYTQQKNVVFLGMNMPFEASLYAIFLFVGIIHFFLLISAFRAQPSHFFQLVLLSMCWGYLLLNLVFISIWLVAMTVGNWHRQREESEVIEALVSKSKIPENSFFLQFLGKLSSNSLWSHVQAFKQIDSLDNKFQVKDFEWRSGVALLHYYLYVFHQYSLSHFHFCIPQNKNKLFVEYERQLTKLNSNQYSEIYSDEVQDIQKSTSGFWIGRLNFSVLSLTIVIAIFLRFVFMIISFFVDHFTYTNAVNQAISNGTALPDERRSMFFNNLTIFVFFLVIYSIQFVGFRAYSNRLRKRNGLVRLSGLINYMNVDYELKGIVPNELPPINVFCLLSLESWYSLRRLLNKLIKSESRIFDLEVLISVGLIALIVTISILGYLKLNNIDWVYTMISQNPLAMFGFYIDFFLLVAITVYKLNISADINQQGTEHQKLLEKHLYVLKSMNGANIMASNINEHEDFNSKSLRELQKQTKFYLLNGTLECADEHLASYIKSGQIANISDITDNSYEHAIVTAFTRYTELLIEKVETIIKKIQFDEQKHREVLAFVLPIKHIIVYIVLFGSLAILLPLTSGAWLQQDYTSTLIEMVMSQFF